MRRSRSSLRFAVLCAVFVGVGVVCVVLGRWQLERAEQARAVGEAFRAASEQPALRGFDRARSNAEALRYRRLRLEGRFVEDAQVLLDNITRQGRTGYYVLTPFEPAGGGPAVLVNRGWIRAEPDRRVVRALDVDARPRMLTGRIDGLPAAAISLGGEAEQLRDGLYRASFPSWPELEAMLERELAPFQLKLAPGAADGFAREWTPDTSRADTNTAYAGQWFIMALGAAGLAVWAALRAFRATRGHFEGDETAT